MYILWNFLSDAMRYYIHLSSLYICGNWGTESLSNLPRMKTEKLKKVMPLVNLNHYILIKKGEVEEV